MKLMKLLTPFFKTVIIFSFNLTSLIAEKGLTQIIEVNTEVDTDVNTIAFKDWEIEAKYNLLNYQTEQTYSYFDTVNQLNSYFINLSKITVKPEKLTESTYLTQNDTLTSQELNISQQAIDLQIKTETEGENQQKFRLAHKTLLENSEIPEMVSQSTENSASEETNLAEQSQNPIANLISLPFQNNTNFGVGELDRTQNILNIQPVIPIDLNDDWLLVSRTILPVVYQPALNKSQDSHFGLGDLNPQLFFVPKTDSKVTWGVGPVFLLPTATDDSLGTGKWGIGPTAVVVVTDAPFVYGALANNIWSVAGDSDRSDVSQFLLQPFINYNLPNGWYLISAPIVTANWNATSGNKWTIPVGGGVGRVFRIGEQSVNASLQGYWNAETPEGGCRLDIKNSISITFPYQPIVLWLITSQKVN